MNAPLTLTASQIGSSFSNDPELQLPRFPRFPPEILVIPYGASGLLFEGGAGTQVLSGRGARGFIPLLLEHLDGSNDIDALYARFPKLPTQAIRDAVALLFSRGLLEDGGAGEVVAEKRDLAAFAGRFADVTRVNRNREEVLARLASVRVAIVGNDAAAGVVASALSDLGLGEVGRPDSPSALAPVADLVVAVFSGDEDPAPWLDAANALGVQVLHAHMGAECIEVGPLFVPGRSACHSCLRELRAAPRGEPAATDVGVWSAVIALHAFNLASRLGRQIPYNVCHLHRRTASGPLYEEQKLARLPGCRQCGLEDRRPRLRERNGQVWLLHNAANAMPPRSLLSPRDHQMHYASGNQKITQEVPEPYRGAVPRALPADVPLDMPPAWVRPAPRDRQLDLATLGTLLRVSVGYQQAQDGARRATPSAGGLGSAQMFVVAQGIDGLDDGAYHYYAPAHRLDRLRDADPVVVAAALGIEQRQLPPVVMIGIGSHEKLRLKYGNFAFRFSSLDAGFARTHLTEALDATGIPSRDFADSRDAALAKAIGLPVAGARNVVTFAIGVGVAAWQPHPSRVEAYQYVDDLVRLSNCRDAGIPGSDDAQVAALLAPPPAAPVPVSGRGTLGAIFGARRSVREYAPRPVPAALLRDIARLGTGAVARINAQGGLPVEIGLWLAINHGTEEMPAGVYRWDGVESGFACVRSGLGPEELEPTMLQRSLARAPAVCFLTGNFEQAVLDHGGRGYRELIARAGAVASRALLAATSHGVSGCPWGGLCEDGWGELLGIDRYRDCPMFGLSLGYDDAG